MAKALTFEGLMDYARANYNKGGDTVFECWDEKFFQEYTQMFGPITKSRARQMFRVYKSQQDDIEKTAW